MKILSGHQPVYLPWLGLLHKASLCDVFVYMDDVQYLEQDWNNRNKIKTGPNQWNWLTVPVDLKNSETRLLKDIKIKAEDLPFEKSWQAKHWKSLQVSYGKAPYFKVYSEVFEAIYKYKQWMSLSELNLEILLRLFDVLEISPELVIASQERFTEKKSNLILEHARRFSADLVVTGTHGKDYIQSSDFEREGIKVYFQDYQHPCYSQRFDGFVSHLSALDLLFNCGPQSKEILLSGNIQRSDL